MSATIKRRLRIGAVTVGLSAVLTVGVASVGKASSGITHAHRISGHALGIVLPTGWDGHVFAHPPPCPCAVLQASNFPLPARDDAAGSKALARMRQGDVRVLLTEVGNPPGRRFPPTRLPLRIDRRDFTGRAPGIPTDHAVATRTFWTAGRSFVLLIDSASKRVPERLLRQLGRTLATLAIRPTRPLLVEAGWRRLHRPLQLPTEPSNGACPRTRGGRTTPATAFGFGSGPVYAVLGARGAISLTGHITRDGGTLLKTLWAIAPRYRGPLLIRGAQLDGHGAMHFHLGGPIRTELRLSPASYGSHHWRYQPSDTVVPGPGCYALQIDGNSFTETVVFAATRS